MAFFKGDRGAHAPGPGKPKDERGWRGASIPPSADNPIFSNIPTP
ncbi:hypothetical protein BEL01nite_65700 [Bradyrhizobium elkanii]|jgi:hypothetical protein|nr:hypothetical protein BEL01nite_65700 [Bradyrhizobium elkanii]